MAESRIMSTNLVDNTKGLQNIYLQRIFSGKFEWSQGGMVNEWGPIH